MTETPFFGGALVRVLLGLAAGGLGEPIWVVRLGGADRRAFGLALPRSCLGSSHYE